MEMQQVLRKWNKISIIRKLEKSLYRQLCRVDKYFFYYLHSCPALEVYLVLIAFSAHRQAIELHKSGDYWSPITVVNAESMTL